MSDRQASHPGIHLSREAGETDEYQSLAKGVGKGRGYRWHDLRHTWAYWHIQSGTSLERLQEIGGWESVEMVHRYAHMAPEHLAEDSAKIESILENVCPHGTNTSQPHFFPCQKIL